MKIILAVLFTISFASGAAAFDVNLSRNISQTALKELKECTEGRCAAKALQKAASRMNGRPDYSEVASALRKVAKILSKCQSDGCMHDDYKAHQKLAISYQARFSKAKQPAIRQLASLFDPGKHNSTVAGTTLGIRG